MWKSKSKDDLMIEVWEKLDCESVGTTEIQAIETVVADVFGTAAVDSPMVIARLLADEGAELRHSEVMTLYVERASDRPYDAALLNILNTADLGATLSSIRRMENLRRKFAGDGDREGSRLLRRLAVDEKEKKLANAGKERSDPRSRAEAREIAEWLTLWLQSPEVFETWVTLRRRSQDFISQFGEIRE
ncbi:MAG: hypothetical protein H0U23_16395 [Blastocatellia bacterium]|nr:hypothetical protein [Blastocatellia bacterium]